MQDFTDNMPEGDGWRMQEAVGIEPAHFEPEVDSGDPTGGHGMHGKDIRLARNHRRRLPCAAVV